MGPQKPLACKTHRAYELPRPHFRRNTNLFPCSQAVFIYFNYVLFFTIRVFTVCELTTLTSENLGFLRGR